MSWPSIHKAGQTPRARGIFIRACISPYRNETRSLLISRAEVYPQPPYRRRPRSAFTRRATMARFPAPSMAALPGSSA
jgi:hypothetical protein